MEEMRRVILVLLMVMVVGCGGTTVVMKKRAEGGEFQEALSDRPVRMLLIEEKFEKYYHRPKSWWGTCGPRHRRVGPTFDEQLAAFLEAKPRRLLSVKRERFYKHPHRATKGVVYYQDLGGE